VLITIVVAALATSGCTGNGGSGSAASSSTSAAAVPSSPKTIPQPPLNKLSKLTRGRLAPDSERVDLVQPTFSEPTKVTNPLFPISSLNAVIVGEVDGAPLKIETTLLPETRTVHWGGQRVQALQSQFCAYLKGRITEVAVDLYAQADDGSVWYFGEDVVDYANGVAATTAGTWRVGLDGPPAMIMPAHPKVGDVYRTENIPGVAFEQVTVKKVGVTVNGPSGPIPGAMVGQELHQDETALEPKTFAPGHGEWFSGGGHDFEANALAVPADALPAPTPAELTTLSSGAYDVLDAARSKDWKVASVTVKTMTNDWTTVQAGEVPERLGTRMRQALHALAAAVEARSSRTAPQAALEVADASLDLQLRYRPVAEINRARLELWARQLLVDAAAKNPAAVQGDVTTLAWIRDRIALDRVDANGIDDQLRYLRSVADAHEFEVAMVQAARLHETLAGLKPTP
jgi:head-tail adaptor